MDGSAISAFPAEAGYAMVLFPGARLWRTEFEAGMGSHLTYNYLTTVFLGEPTGMSLNLKAEMKSLTK